MNNTITLIRKYLALSQTQMADRLGVCKSYMSEIEAGKKPLSLEKIETMASILQVPVSAIFILHEIVNEIPTTIGCSGGMLRVKHINEWRQLINEK